MVIDGFGEKRSGHISHDSDQNLTLDLATADTTNTADEDTSVPTDIERAIGVLETGECATLKNLSLTKHRRCTRKYSVVTVSYSIGEMFVGDDVFSAQKFDLISVTFKGLLEWMDQRSLKTTHKTANKFAIEHTNPQIPAVTLDDGSTLEVVFIYKEHKTIPTEEFALLQSTAFNIRTKVPISFKSLYYKALQFNRFIMLVTNTFMPMTSIQVRAGGDLFGVLGRYKTYDSTIRINYPDFNSHYTDMRQNFGSAVNGWFDLYGRHEVSLNLYFDTWVQKNRMGLDIQFLRTVQSLESFDKENEPKKRMLKERLQTLLEIPYNILEAGTTKSDFVNYVIKIRNSYSHGDVQDPKNLRQYAVDLLKGIRMLELLLHGNVIHALPIPNNTKNKIMANKIHQFKQLAELNDSDKSS